MIYRFSGKYFFLSNFYITPINVDGKVYPSVEHAYQAAKTLDKYARDEVCEAPTPGEAKKLGRRLALRPDWEEVKLDVMHELLIKKFMKMDMRKKLLATGKEKLVEGNNWGDRYWGVCDGKGENHLGKLLMEVRSFLRSDVPY